MSKAAAGAGVVRIGRDAEESTESIAIKGLPKLTADAGEDYSPTIVQAPLFDEVDDGHKDNQTRFLNSKDDAGLFDLGQRVAAYVHEVKATITSHGKTTQHSVLDLSQKHVVIAGKMGVLQLGSICEVSLRCGERTADFKAIILRKIERPEPGLGLHISALTRAQLTDLVLLIEEASRSRGKKKRKGVPSIIAIAIVAAGVLGVVGLFAARPAPTPVEVVHAKRGDVVDAVRGSGPGEVVAQHKATVRSPLAAARIFKMTAKRGDRVKKGAVLGRAEDPDLTRAVALARSRVGLADAELKKATAAMLNSEEGAADRLVATRTLVDETRAVLGAREAELAKTVVIAPMGGLVTEVFAAGDFVAPTSPLLEIVDDTTLRARVPFPEIDVPRIAVGMRAEVLVPGVAEAYKGKVEEVGVTVRSDGSTRSVVVDIALEPDVKIRPGSTATGSVPIGIRKDILSLPIGAVDTSQGRARVVVVDEKLRAAEHTINVGVLIGDRLEIKDGIDENADVILGPNGVKPGQRLEPKRL